MEHLKKAPSSTHGSDRNSGKLSAYGGTTHSIKTARTGFTKRTTAGRKALKVIEWYFYPEYAPKKLFKNKCVKTDLKQVTGKHYEVLSQASNAWSHSATSQQTAERKTP